MSRGISVDETIDCTVVDVDAHYTGKFEDLIEYIDEGPWKGRFEAGATAAKKPSNKGFWPSITSAHDAYRNPSGWEMPETREGMFEVMDDLAIDKIVFLGEQMITFDQMKGDDKRPIVYANAYTDYMLDRMIDPDNGIYGTVPVAPNDPERSAELIERVGDEEGIVGVCFITSMSEPPLGNRRYDPIYEAAEKKEIGRAHV